MKKLGDMGRLSLPFERRLGTSVLVIGAIVASLLLALPILFVVASVFQQSDAGMGAVSATQWGRYILNTLVLAAGTGIGALSIGVTGAWLVTMCRFPGRAIFEWALILPLAAPAYVLAYAYTDFLQHPGPVQTLLRAVTGWGANDYWFPNIRSIPGAILIFSFVLYPYVYLLARVAFLEQSARAFEASRSLGANAWESFWRVVLPIARPNIVAGLALVLMETLADFGTVSHFGVVTFTTGIYQAWFSIGDRVLAGQLASALLGFVVLLLLIEQISRRAKPLIREGNFQPLVRFELSGARAALATTACLVPVIIGFLLPVVLLLYLTAIDGHRLFGARYVGLTFNTLSLGLVTAVLAVGLGLLISHAGRIMASAGVRKVLKLASLGYAIPGSIIAVGILVPLAGLDNAIDSFTRDQFGFSTGLIFTGTVAAIVYAYLVRFMAVPLNAIDASLNKVNPNMDAAARSLGRSRTEVLTRIHIPIISGSLLTSGMIVFVEVVKELPATMIMRPFNFDTLAIQAYRLASDERLAEASTASLVIVLVGLFPVIYLSRQIGRAGRPPK